MPSSTRVLVLASVLLFWKTCYRQQRDTGRGTGRSTYAHQYLHYRQTVQSGGRGDHTSSPEAVSAEDRTNSVNATGEKCVH